MKRNIYFPAFLLGLALVVPGVIYFSAYFLDRSPVDYPLKANGNTYSLLSDNSPEEENESPSSEVGPRVAIVIDDLGWRSDAISVFDEISAPLTMAVLPGRPKSRDLYRRWQNKFEFILHMPMEPQGYPEDDPGDFALFSSMTREEIRNTLTRALKRYPRVVGINNHMGSKFITYRAGMGVVMEELDNRNLYFLDSNTTSASVAMKVAPRQNVPAVKNNVFLDRYTKRKKIRRQFSKLVKKARKEGAAIGIGHIQTPNTALVLRELIPKYEKQGVNFVYLSELVQLPHLQYQSPGGIGEYIDYR